MGEVKIIEIDFALLALKANQKAAETAAPYAPLTDTPLAYSVTTSGKILQLSNIGIMYLEDHWIAQKR